MAENDFNMFALYQTRPIRFLELYRHEGWTLKLYSISTRAELVTTGFVRQAKASLAGCIPGQQDRQFADYKLATLILHEGMDNRYVLINWWTGENMMQQKTFVSAYETPEVFTSCVDKGLFACVWELAVLCHERAAWLSHVLQKAPAPDFHQYLQDQLNDDV